MKKMSLALVMLIACMVIPTASAEVLYDETIEFFEFTGGKSTFSRAAGSGTYPGPFNYFVLTDAAKMNDLNYIGVDFPGQISSLPEGASTFTYTYNGLQKTGTVHTTYSRNALSQVIGSRFIFFFDDWDNYGLQGSQRIDMSVSLASWYSSGSKPVIVDGDSPVTALPPYANSYTITVSSGIDFKNRLIISSEDDGNVIVVNIVRDINNKKSRSILNVYDFDDNIIYTDDSVNTFEQRFLAREVSKVSVVKGDREYVYPITSESLPDTSPIINIYVRNSQNNALISNSHIVINASVNGTFHEFINESLLSGTYNGPLQPTGGGFPNPDFYRLIPTADGYNSIMPYIDFEVDGTTTIYAYMDPIAGGPIDENKTFIDFFVRDLSANPISGATVNFGGYTMITNSAGYGVLEVSKNATYTYTVSKSGYGSLTGNVVIGADPRHTINTVLAPAVTPTTQTPIPTGTAIGPTPTMTAPNGEPVSNWLEWFAAHFGMILGGGVEIGKIFMWLCFTVPVGVYVGKESKAGAAGFMAGAGIVTLFFVLIGWVPIWLVVLLALIIGLLYAKVFSNSDNGGGR